MGRCQLRKAQALSEFIVAFDSRDLLLPSLVVSWKSRPGWLPYGPGVTTPTDLVNDNT
jgi:hypothetical protein